MWQAEAVGDVGPGPTWDVLGVVLADGVSLGERYRVPWSAGLARGSGCSGTPENRERPLVPRSAFRAAHTESSAYGQRLHAEDPPPIKPVGECKPRRAECFVRVRAGPRYRVPRAGDVPQRPTLRYSLL